MITKQDIKGRTELPSNVEAIKLNMAGEVDGTGWEGTCFFEPGPTTVRMYLGDLYWRLPDSSKTIMRLRHKQKVEECLYLQALDALIDLFGGVAIFMEKSWILSPTAMGLVDARKLLNDEIRRRIPK